MLDSLDVKTEAVIVLHQLYAPSSQSVSVMLCYVFQLYPPSCLFLTGVVISLYSLEMFFYEAIKWYQQHVLVLPSHIQFPALLMTYSKTNFISQAGQFPPLFMTYSKTKFVSHSSQFQHSLYHFDKKLEKRGW
jgi:hypothetical protein